MDNYLIKNNKVLKLLLLGTISFMSLTGCTGMNSQFGCNATAGDTCTPVDRVNEQAQVGAYNNRLAGSSSIKRIAAPTKSKNYLSSRGDRQGYDIATPFPGEPIRFGEKIQRIWIAPFEDTAGNYHEPSYVFTVLKGSHWIGLPTERVKNT